MCNYEDFKSRFKLLVIKNRHIVINTLSNIFTMRLIGNKTHGDLAEIGLVEFINQFMYDFRSIHVGKDRFRAKEYEEDIMILNEIKKTEFPVSLKAYGNGPLQLSTDSKQKVFPFLKKQGKEINKSQQLIKIFESEEFSEIGNINIMPLIYDERNKCCNIMIFDYKKAMANTHRIILIEQEKKFDFTSGTIISGGNRKHPIYMFVDSKNNYICEVRYGGASANALQRGFWTHTKNALNYFDSLTNGWINYSHNHTLVKLFSLALNSSENGHKVANKVLQEDINRLKKHE